MKAAVDTLVEAKKTFDQAIDQVLSEPRGPKRWRAANTFWLRLSPKNQKIYSEVCEENRITREAVNKFGMAKGTQVGSSDHSVRNYLNIPVGAYTAIEKADPDVFKQKSNSKKFFGEFKEYTTRELY